MAVRAENFPPLIEPNEELADEDTEKYLRGKGPNLEVVKDKKLKGQLAVKEGLNKRSAITAKNFQKWLLPSVGGFLEADGIEKTWRFKQEDIGHEVDILSKTKQFDMVLPDHGPYTINYISSGRYMALAGRKGHLSLLDVKSLKLIKEFQVRETVRDVTFLHNDLFFAAAQKKYTYIYNRDGVELHCLKEHGAVLKLQFLKNHFLLSSINKCGQLHYQDVTTGQMMGNHRTGLGRTDLMRLNPYNAVISVGHSCGTVTMWNPSNPNPLVKMLCHKGPLTALAHHPNGHLMATAGAERKIKIWDLRKYEVLQTIPGNAKSLDFSQKGLLATSSGSFVQVLRDSGSHNYTRYMSHSMAKGYQIHNVAFRPYEDVLGLGHSMGWSSILVPGSGEPNFDSWVANPFETKKQRREKEIRSLMEKLPPESIMLDPKKIGTVKPVRKKKPSRKQREEEEEAAVAAVKGKELKNKTKGKNRPTKKARKKQEMFENAKRPFIEQKIKEDEESSRIKRQKTIDEADLPKSLQRFVKKKAD
ncbi:hypothetical protein vseg_007783 [Gypsophila vaccaria]